MTIHRPDAAPSPESDEQYVRDVIDSAMSGSRSHLDLAAGALARGRRLRTRRRVAVASVAVAASILAAATAPLVLGGGHSASTGGNLVATQPPTPEPEPVLPYVPSGWWDMPGTDMVDALSAILPDGVTVTDPGSLEADTPEGGPSKGWIGSELAGPAGQGSINIILTPGPAPGMGQIGADVGISCNEQFSGHTQCTELRDGQGTPIGRRLVNRSGGTVTREVVLRRDGGTVYAASANTLDDKWGADSPLSAESPPLTLDDLENLVRNDVWVSHRP